VSSLPPPHVVNGPAHTSHLVLKLQDTLLALPTDCVRSMVLLPPITFVPQRSPAIRGVMNLRGQVLPVLDLRVQLGLPSLQQEVQTLIGILHEREQDHVNWLTELCAATREKRPFTLARDPHKCKFGKWYDTYTPCNQSVAVMSLWRSFDYPHRRIHAIADRINTLTAESRFAAAQALIETTRDTDLCELRQSFDALRTLLRETSREIAVVMKVGDQQFAVGVDEVSAVESFGHTTLQSVPESLGAACGALVSNIYCAANRTILVLNAACLAGGLGRAAA